MGFFEKMKKYNYNDVNNKEGEIEIFEENHMFVVHICVCV